MSIRAQLITLFLVFSLFLALAWAFSGTYPWKFSWVVGAAVVLFGLCALALSAVKLRSHRASTAALAVSSIKEEVEAQAKRERLELLSRFLARYTHEFNNQWGIISNSAHLVERHAEDERLHLPVRAMQRAVERVGLLTRRLQIFNGNEAARPQLIDLDHWLRDNMPALGLALSKQATLKLQCDSGPSKVMVDTAALDLALINLLIFLNEQDENAKLIKLSRTSCGDLLEVRLEVLGDDEGEERAPLRWRLIKVDEARQLGVAARFSHDWGGSLRMAYRAEQTVMLALTLAR